MTKLPKARASKDPAANKHTKEDTGGVLATPRRMQRAIKTPCAECPLRRDSVPGYLGGYSPEMYLEVLHGPASLACHSSPGFHEGVIETQRVCTGVAAYRANVGHVCIANVPGHGPVVTAAQESTDFIGPDAEHYFASPEEFYNHHKPGQK